MFVVTLLFVSYNHGAGFITSISPSETHHNNHDKHQQHPPAELSLTTTLSNNNSGVLRRLTSPFRRLLAPFIAVKNALKGIARRVFRRRRNVADASADGSSEREEDESLTGISGEQSELIKKYVWAKPP